MGIPATLNACFEAEAERHSGIAFKMEPGFVGFNLKLNRAIKELLVQ